MTTAKKSSTSSRHDRLVSVSASDILSKPMTKADQAILRRHADRQAVGNDSQIDFTDDPELTEEQLAQMTRFRDRPRKVAVSVRLDPHVLDWLKAKGDGHLTRINDILANVMEAERRLKLKG